MALRFANNEVGIELHEHVAPVHSLPGRYSDFEALSA
jgi:hypothetical protein